MLAALPCCATTTVVGIISISYIIKRLIEQIPFWCDGQSTAPFRTASFARAALVAATFIATATRWRVLGISVIAVGGSERHIRIEGHFGAVAPNILGQGGEVHIQITVALYLGHSIVA